MTLVEQLQAPVQLRRLQPGDAGHVVDAVFDGMSDESRRLRFHVRLSRLPAYARAELAALDGCSRAAVAAWVDGKPVGIGRLARVGAGEAEIAIEVVDAWQGRGVGRSLLFSVADLAADLGYERLLADVLIENEPMLRLIGSVFPDAVRRCSAGVVHVTCPLAGGTSASSMHLRGYELKPAC